MSDWGEGKESLADVASASYGEGTTEHEGHGEPFR
jgi:hypothetical protein